MKKLICTVIMCFMMIIPMSAMAADNCKISVDNATATADGAVIVTLKIENNPGVAIGKVKLGFDKTKLIPVSVDKADRLSSAYYFTSNLNDPNTDTTELDAVTISWLNMANITGDGNLAVIEFAVQENVTGTTDITVEVSELANDTQSNIAADTASGVITFTSGDNENPNDDIVLGFSTTTVTKTENNIGGDVSVSVYAPASINETVFIYTIFNSSGQLIAMKTKSSELKTGINEVSLGTLNAAASEDSVYYVKVYMWDSIDGMKPLVNEPIIKRY